MKERNHRFLRVFQIGLVFSHPLPCALLPFMCCVLSLPPPPPLTLPSPSGRGIFEPHEQPTTRHPQAAHHPTPTSTPRAAHEPPPKASPFLPNRTAARDPTRTPAEGIAISSEPYSSPTRTPRSPRPEPHEQPTTRPPRAPHEQPTNPRRRHRHFFRTVQQSLQYSTARRRHRHFFPNTSDGHVCIL
jgi:hypothetical protein